MDNPDVLLNVVSLLERLTLASWTTTLPPEQASLPPSLPGLRAMTNEAMEHRGRPNRAAVRGEGVPTFLSSYLGTMTVSIPK
jgi:hypothetical protein